MQNIFCAELECFTFNIYREIIKIRIGIFQYKTNPWKCSNGKFALKNSVTGPLKLCELRSPAGHIGSSARGMEVTRWKSSWQGLQKCVVPKQKKTATEQQKRHLYSRKSVPCLGHICARATSLQPPHTSSVGSYSSPSSASHLASPP